jgi:hypothetical protein
MDGSDFLDVRVVTAVTASTRFCKYEPGREAQMFVVVVVVIVFFGGGGTSPCPPKNPGYFSLHFGSL